MLYICIGLGVALAILLVLFFIRRNEYLKVELLKQELTTTENLLLEKRDKLKKVQEWTRSSEEWNKQIKNSTDKLQLKMQEYTDTVDKLEQEIATLEVSAAELETKIATDTENSKSKLALYEKLESRRIRDALDVVTNECLQKAEQARTAADVEINNINTEKDEAILAAQNQINDIKNTYSALVTALKRAEEEKQAKLFYTVQISEEYHDDISYLLNEVSPKIEHRDIISKLVYNEYIKNELDETLKRLNITNVPGIYKLTSLIDGKVYIGKSTTLKTRITNHFKSAVGIASIADQAVHHAMLKDGLWNWTIEIVCTCSKEELSEKEKYYIDFFQAQNWGYNKNVGG